MTRFGKADDFRVRQVSPFNAGPDLARLAESFVTPVEQFFVRSHGEVPAIEEAGFRLTVGGEVERPLSFSLAELAARFPRREVTALLKCAGNRRAELVALRPIPDELPWGSEAVGNAVWGGVALADVLAAAGPTAAARHVELLGLDETERQGRRIHFGGSIPLAKALTPDVLLAVEMNGAPLSAVHGAPLRALVPGYIGARSVKWLAEIRLRTAPSENYFQARAYRLFPPHVGAGEVVWEEGTALGEVTINSIVTSPAAGARLPAGRVRVAGIALAGGGRRVDRVELSAGSGWAAARLGEGVGRWAWRLWEGELDLPAGDHEIVARAWDSAGHTQPERLEEVWNFKGYMNNAWSRVAVSCG